MAKKYLQHTAQQIDDAVEQVSELSRQMGELSGAVEGKQDTIADLESIRNGATAGATALQPVEGKGLSTNDYTDVDKQKVQNALTEHQQMKTLNGESIVGEGNIVIKPSGSGYIKPSDGIPASDMTEAVRESLDKAETALQPVEGKQLTTEDFTTALKEKLEGLANYNDTEVRGLITSLSNALDKLIGTADTTAAIDTFNEVISFLDNFKNTDSLASTLSSLKTEIEQWVEGKNYLTEHQDISGKVDKEEGIGLSAVTDVTVTEDGKLNITKKDGTTLEFEGGGGIPDAPSDGNQYARKNGEWSKVEGSGGTTLPLSVVDGQLCITFNS